MHSWRHSDQNCLEESCEYVAEDETWLLYHLQERHKYSQQSAHSVTAGRNADEYRLDILLRKYSQVQEQKVDPFFSSSSLVKSEKVKKSSSEKMSLSQKNVKEKMSLSLVTDATSISCKEETPGEVSLSVFGDIIDAVVSVEEEDKKNVKRKEEILRKVFDGGTSSHRCGLCNTYHLSAEELAMHRAEHSQVNPMFPFLKYVYIYTQTY